MLEELDAILDELDIELVFELVLAIMEEDDDFLQVSGSQGVSNRNST